MIQVKFGNKPRSIHPFFNILGNGTGRVSNGNGGLAYWNNYLVVFGNGYIEFCGDLVQAMLE